MDKNLALTIHVKMDVYDYNNLFKYMTGRRNKPKTVSIGLPYRQSLNKNLAWKRISKESITRWNHLMNIENDQKTFSLNPSS